MDAASLCQADINEENSKYNNSKKVMMQKLCVLLAGFFLIACSKSDSPGTPDFSGKILSEEPVENGLYAYVCPKTGSLSEILVAKNFNNAGDNLELAKNPDGTYSAEDITIYPSKGQYLRLPVDVFAKSISYVDMDLNEPDYFGTKEYVPGTYSTFCAPFEMLSLPPGVSAYLVSGIESGNELQLSSIESIPANTPCIPYMPNTMTNKVTLQNANTLVHSTLSNSNSVGDGLLKGVYDDTSIAPEDGVKRYVLQSSGDKFKFLRVTSQITVPANRCYLEIPENQ